VLERVKDPEVRVYVVWVPSLPADKEDRVPAATAKIADARASHFWDEKGSLKAAYQRVMKMEEPAWDVYYLYAGDAEWKGEPPVPVYYQHQLHSLPPDRMLDADKLAAEMEKLLRPAR
jgi:hypothetical protein